MRATYTINEKLGGIEISFDGCPDETTRDTLKANGFRWHRKNKYWYAHHTDEREAIARDICETADDERAPEPRQIANRFGVKVGDLFESSWGYEQTNVDFFQVVELVGSTSVRVREVNPVMVSEESYSHGMAADRVYQNTGELLPPTTFSVFIKDQEKGDLKRLKSYAADGVSRPQFKISSFADAYHVTGDTIKTYESWYY